MHQKGKRIKPRFFILDVDGVLTTGQMFYTSSGKEMKVFGPDDNDALSLLKPFLKIHFISSDKRGFAISRQRIVRDMGYPLDLVHSSERARWISSNYDEKKVIYMGDGIFDPYVMSKVGYSIAPANADMNAKEIASYTTKRSGGDRAVAEACLHILEIFFSPYDPLSDKGRFK